MNGKINLDRRKLLGSALVGAAASLLADSAMANAGKKAHAPQRSI
jgi:hypothetical protein